MNSTRITNQDTQDSTGITNQSTQDSTGITNQGMQDSTGITNQGMQNSTGITNQGTQGHLQHAGSRRPSVTQAGTIGKALPTLSRQTPLLRYTNKNTNK